MSKKRVSEGLRIGKYLLVEKSGVNSDTRVGTSLHLGDVKLTEDRIIFSQDVDDGAKDFIITHEEQIDTLKEIVGDFYIFKSKL